MAEQKYIVGIDVGVDRAAVGPAGHSTAVEEHPGRSRHPVVGVVVTRPDRAHGRVRVGEVHLAGVRREREAVGRVGLVEERCRAPVRIQPVDWPVSCLSVA